MTKTQIVRTLLAKIVLDEITEAYDLVEGIANRISIAQRPDVSAEVEAAKEHLFRARVLAEGRYEE